DPAEIEPFIDWRGIWLRKADGKIEETDAPVRTSSMTWNSSRLVALNGMLKDMQRLPDGYYHLAMSSEYPYMALLTERFHNPGWISVADQLPEDGQEVLVWMNGTIRHCTYEERSNSFLFGHPTGGGVVHDEVQDYDHWMPLPEPPKKPE